MGVTTNRQLSTDKDADEVALTLSLTLKGCEPEAAQARACSFFHYFSLGQLHFKLLYWFPVDFVPTI
jgi:hypothetical protein